MSFEDFDTILENEGGALPQALETRGVILVVDDDHFVRQVLHTMFRRSYDVLLCASAEEGVAAVHDEVCAAVLDVKMPGHDGFWACNEIRKSHPLLPIIFYSAYQDSKDPFAIINEHRPFGYITKDGGRERLLRAVDEAARLHRLTLREMALTRELRKRDHQEA